MPYKDRRKQLDYQNRWMQERKRKWFLEQGSCVQCGSSENLEVDHIDPTKKVTHNIWSWSDKRRQEELEKCQVLCYECHLAKTQEYARIIPPDPSLSWCGKCKQFLPLDDFCVDNKRWNGVSSYCSSCKSISYYEKIAQ